MFSIKVVPILILSFVISTCSEEENGTNQNIDTTSELQNFKDWNVHEDDDFRIKYPESWKLDLSGKSGTEFALFSPKKSFDTPLGANISLRVENLPFDANLDVIIENSLNGLHKQIPDGELIVTERLNSNGNDFQKIIFIAPQQKLNTELKFEQFLWVKNKTAYVLTFTAQLDEFEIYKDVGEKILNSFTLK